MSRELDQQEDLSSWQLDLDGIQLVERGHLFAEKLAQNSRRGRYLLGSLGKKCVIFFDALMTRVGLVEGAFDSRVDLDELHVQAERSR